MFSGGRPLARPSPGRPDETDARRPLRSEPFSGRGTTARQRHTAGCRPHRRSGTGTCADYPFRTPDRNGRVRRHPSARKSLSPEIRPAGPAGMPPPQAADAPGQHNPDDESSERFHNFYSIRIGFGSRAGSASGRSATDLVEVRGISGL